MFMYIMSVIFCLLSVCSTKDFTQRTAKKSQLLQQYFTHDDYFEQNLNTPTEGEKNAKNRSQANNKTSEILLSNEKNSCCKLIYKPAELVLGKEFSAPIAKTVCEACIRTRGSSVGCIRFTKKGINMCNKVCNRQDLTLLRVPPTVAVLKDSYCTKELLKAATCVCVFKVMCYANRHYVLMHFTTNGKGDVAMQYFEAGLPLKMSL